jgi:hypothetical protein
MRDRTFKNQRYRASGLDLVVAAIILWKTVYLETAIRLRQQKGRSISNEPLVHLSPLGWEYINLNGRLHLAHESADCERSFQTAQPATGGYYSLV